VRSHQIRPQRRGRGDHGQGEVPSGAVDRADEEATTQGRRGGRRRPYWGKGRRQRSRHRRGWGLGHDGWPTAVAAWGDSVALREASEVGRSAAPQLRALQTGEGKSMAPALEPSLRCAPAAGEGGTVARDPCWAHLRESRRGPGGRIYAPLPRDVAVDGRSMRPSSMGVHECSFLDQCRRGWRGGSR